MKYLATLLLIFSICSCSGLSESSALKMVEETNCQALYRPIQIGEYYALADSSFVCIGFGHLKRVSDDYTYESVHKIDWDSFTPELKFVDGNGAVVFLDASGVSLHVDGLPDRCYGCIKCLEKYAEKGLLTFKILKEGSNHLVNVELTKKGEKYLMNNPNGLTIMEDGGYADVKLAEKKFCKVEEVFQNEKRADFFVSYYMDYTPWAEAMGYNTDKKHIRTMRVTFTNNDGEWVIDETESTKRNG